MPKLTKGDRELYDRALAARQQRDSESFLSWLRGFIKVGQQSKNLTVELVRLKDSAIEETTTPNHDETKR